MAFQLPTINLGDAKTRVIIIFSGIIGFVAVIYAAVHFLSNKSATTGTSHVASAPGGLQSVPGGQLTPEYYRALVQANTQAAKQAKISGGSAVPTLLNEPGAQPELPSTSCTVVCPTEENVNVENDINDLMKAGKLSTQDGKDLIDLAKSNVAVSSFAASLGNLIKQGKLSPESGRKLLDDYKKQHDNLLLQESGRFMDKLIKAGQLPIDIASDLLDAQRKHATLARYAAQLNKSVRQGKISSNTAAQLLAQYAQQQAREGAAEALGQLEEMAVTGQIAADVANELEAYQKRHVTPKEYDEELQHLVKQNRLKSEQAQRLSEQYKKQIPPGVATELADYQKRNVPLSEYQAELNRLVAAGKISPEQAGQLLEQYRQIKATITPLPAMAGVNKEEAARLNALQANNAPVDEYADALKRAVAAGIITPDQAVQLLKEYQEYKTRAAGPPLTPPPTTVKGNEAFAELQRRVQATAPTVAPPAVTHGQFSAVAAKAKAEEERAEQERIQTLMGTMSSQAGQLISSWQPPTMAGQMGSAETESKHKKTEKTEKTTASGTASTGSAGAGEGGSQGAPLIKAGTIIYAVLDTGINSDFPDSPVLATIVQGQFKGAKLLGKVAITKDQDRVALTFNLMNMEDWTTGKTINAYAIDPDTARTALASNVNYHYFLRYGGLFASSFLQGYASAISNSGATTSSGIFGTTTTHPTLSPSSKIMTGLGQVGTTLGQSIQSYTSTPPTVKIDPGVSLGILFMQDVAGG